MAFTKAVSAVPLARILAVLAKCDMADVNLIEMIESEAIPMRSKGSSIVVGLEGGIITGFSFRELDDPNDFEVITADYDIKGADDSEVVTFEDPNGVESRALLCDESGDFTDYGAGFVKAVSDAYDKHRSDNADDGQGDAAPAPASLAAR